LLRVLAARSRLRSAEHEGGSSPAAFGDHVDERDEGIRHPDCQLQLLVLPQQDVPPPERGFQPTT
jgi:hypothetical protein